MDFTSSCRLEFRKYIFCYSTTDLLLKSCSIIKNRIDFKSAYRPVFQKYYFILLLHTSVQRNKKFPYFSKCIHVIITFPDYTIIITTRQLHKIKYCCLPNGSILQGVGTSQTGFLSEYRFGRKTDQKLIIWKHMI